MRRFRPNIGVSLPFRLALVSFLLNLAVEASGVFLPLYAKSVGSSNLEIGLITSTYGIAFFFSSLLLGRQSDIHGRLRFIRAGLGFSAIAYLSQIVAHTPIALLAARGFIGFCLGGTSAAVMAYTYENQKQIGSFVSYGSLGWLFGALAAAVLRDYEPLFLASAISSILAFWVSLMLREERISRVQVAVFPLPIIKANRKVYLAFFIRQLGANAIWAIFPLYLADIGASKLWIAILDGINNGGQFVAMRFVERFNPAKMFRMGLLISALVFVIYGIANNYLQLVPVQIMLAIAWSSMFIGALSYLLRKSNEHGTVSGLLYSAIYLSAGLGPFLGGAVAQVWGFVTVMYFGSSLGFLSFLSSWGLSTGKKIAVTEFHT
jgi:MFS family permease